VNVILSRTPPGRVNTLLSKTSPLTLKYTVKVPSLPPVFVTVADMLTGSPGLTSAGLTFNSLTRNAAGAVVEVVEAGSSVGTVAVVTGVVVDVVSRDGVVDDGMVEVVVEGVVKVEVDVMLVVTVVEVVEEDVVAVVVSVVEGDVVVVVTVVVVAGDVVEVVVVDAVDVVVTVVVVEVVVVVGTLAIPS